MSGPGTVLRVRGSGVLSAAGDGAAALAAAVAAGTLLRSAAPVTADAPPQPSAPVVPSFDVKARLGRKGTRFWDRVTALAVTACSDALADAHVTPLTPDRSLRVGLVLGTTGGSLASTSDYSRETLVQPKPYLVDPALFPTTVMNCASGQAAIRLGLRGPNATVAGGPLAMLQSLRYAATVLRQGYADTMLVGAVEEFSAHRAWRAALCGPAEADVGSASPTPDGPSPDPGVATRVRVADRSVAAGVAGEGVAVLVVEPAGRQEPGALAAAGAPGAGSAEGGVMTVRSSAAGFAADPGARADALAACAASALRRAGLGLDDVVTVATTSGDCLPEVAAVADRAGAALLDVTPALGDCEAATGALALAAVLGDPARHAGGCVLLCGVAPDGALAVAVVTAGDVTAADVTGGDPAGDVAAGTR